MMVAKSKKWRTPLKVSDADRMKREVGELLSWKQKGVKESVNWQKPELLKGGKGNV